MRIYLLVVDYLHSTNLCVPEMTYEQSERYEYGSHLMIVLSSPHLLHHVIRICEFCSLLISNQHHAFLRYTTVTVESYLILHVEGMAGFTTFYYVPPSRVKQFHSKSYYSAFARSQAGLHVAVSYMMRQFSAAQVSSLSECILICPINAASPSF
jgi:hypothetical protein